MLINIFTIVLGETLEAGLLFSILFYSCFKFSVSKRWVFMGVACGMLLATLYGSHLVAVSEWFDYTGQELVNAIICSLLAVCLFFLAKGFISLDRLAFVPVLLLSMLAIIHEGAELYLFFQSVPQQDLVKAYFSASIALIVGSSFGVLNYFVLQYLQAKGSKVAFVVTMVIGCGLFMQATQLLIQADVLPQFQPLWNSEFLLSERSSLGELLRAMIRYESSPSIVEVVAYVFGLLSFLSLKLIRPVNSQ